jgi:hypothetical protein
LAYKNHICYNPDMAERPISMRGFRTVESGVQALLNRDLTDSTGIAASAELFTNYHARLKEQAARSDSPEISALYLLSGACNPSVFPSSSRFTLKERPLTRPGKDASHPLFALAQYTQSQAWGSVYLRGAENWTPQGINPETKIAVLEWHFSEEATPYKNQKARVPLIFRPGENEYGVINKTINALKEFETKVALFATFGNNRRDPLRLNVEYTPMWWPYLSQEVRLNSPIVGALQGEDNVDQSRTEFFDITLRAGRVIRTWPGGTISPLLRLWQPDERVWKEWSFHNTLIRVGQMSFENIARILREATISDVHLNMQILASHAEAVVGSIKKGIAKRGEIRQAREVEARRLEDEFWNNFRPE